MKFMKSPKAKKTTSLCNTPTARTYNEMSECQSIIFIKTCETLRTLGVDTSVLGARHFGT